MKPVWLRRILPFVLAGAALAALGYTFFRADPIPVTVFRAARGRVEETVTNSKAGTVRSRRRAELSPEIGGRVVSLPVRKGERVRKGQTLLAIAEEDPLAQAHLNERAIDAARASEREACRSAEQAAVDHERYARLAEERVVSQELLDRYRNSRDAARDRCEAARASSLQAEAALSIARVALSKTRVEAPFDGVVADIDTEVGEWITPSPPGLPIPPVIEIFDPHSLYISVPMDEVDVGKVRVGDRARVTMDSLPGRALAARVARVAPYVLDVVEQNRTFEIEAELDDETLARTLLPGTSADIEVVLQSRDGVLRVPTHALIEGGRVLAVENGALAAFPVETGLRNWEFTEIRSGLREGAYVVVSLDRAEIREGARARIASETEK